MGRPENSKVKRVHVTIQLPILLDSGVTFSEGVHSPAWWPGLPLGESAFTGSTYAWLDLGRG